MVCFYSSWRSKPGPAARPSSKGETDQSTHAVVRPTTTRPSEEGWFSHFIAVTKNCLQEIQSNSNTINHAINRGGLFSQPLENGENFEFFDIKSLINGEK